MGVGVGNGGGRVGVARAGVGLVRGVRDCVGLGDGVVVPRGAGVLVGGVAPGERVLRGDVGNCSSS